MSVIKPGSMGFGNNNYYKTKPADMTWTKENGYHLIVDGKQIKITDAQADSGLLTHDLHLSDDGIKLALAHGIKFE